MRLVEAYSRTAGLRIDKMLITDQFFPLGIDGPFIVVVTSTGAPAKNYSYFRRVVDVLRPALHAKGYKIVQVGNKDDERIGADIDVCGRTTIYQYFNILSRCELVLSGDTSAIHAAGHYDKKIVSLFSISHPKISGALFGNPENQKYLVPPGDWRPSYNPNEHPKLIDKIKPEAAVKAVSDLLDLNVPPFETLFIGGDYRMMLLESIPDTIVRPDFCPQAQLSLRFDKGGDENVIYEQLKYRKAVIATDKPLNTQNLAQLRPHVEGIIYIVTENDDPKFLESLHRNGIPYRLVSLMSVEDVQKKKLSYADFNLLERRDPTSKTNISLEGEINEKTRFWTSKRVLSGGKVYLSYAHVETDKPLDNITQGEDNVIDLPSFWEDANFYHIFNKENV